MEITKFSRFPRKDTTPRKKIVVLGRIQGRPCTQNPEVKLILQQKKELHGWKPDSEIHGWNGSCNTPQESVAYLHYYYKCADEKMCFLCEKTFMEYQNQPCGCTMWCSNCAKWVTNTLPHACIVCREEVVFLIEITAQSVQGGTREEALEFDVYNQGRFKTELRNKWQETGKHAYGDNHRFAQGITELRPINPGMFTTDLNPAMYKTEPWYSNNHQFAHGIMDLRPIKPGMLERIETELNPAMFKTEPWYGNNHQFAHGITDICPINRGMFERIETELNPAMFKTEPRYGNNHQFPHGITEMRPINPGMFTAMLNPAMLKTEPWYSNNHQFAHGIMGPINPGMFTTELKPGLFQTEPWNGDNCQLAHWINEKPPVHLGTFKTELCNKWQETGSYPYGDKCQFAHGITELRPVIRHPSYKTEVCRTFLASNTCPYGHRCHFRHSLAE